MRTFVRQGGIIAILAAAVLVSCAGKKTSSAADDADALTLDNAIKQAAARIDERIAEGTKIALLNFKSPSDRFSEYFISELEANLLDNGKLTIIDRKEIDLIRSEMIFQTSGEVSDESIQKIGQKLGAQSIVSGSLMEIGKTYRVVVRVLNVETAAVAAQYRNDIKNDDRVQALLADRNSPTTLGINYATGPKRPTSTSTAAPLSATESAAVGTEATPPASAPTQTQAPVASVAENKVAPAADPKKIYKLGDTGPAGGLIFYDKENNLDGWRYMEAAPASTEKKFAWWVQRYLKTIPSKQNFDVGNGKKNTLELMNLVNENCGIYNNEIPPILYCSTLEVNGYKDWFLPSVDELKLMRRNLHIRGLGNFSNDEMYWSSNWAYGGAGGPYCVDFRYGEDKIKNVSNTFYVRAARRF
jgi:TolB-like protein